jgi:hypothetical protein
LGYPVGRAPFLDFVISVRGQALAFLIYRVQAFRKCTQFAEQNLVRKVSFFASHAVGMKQ